MSSSSTSARPDRPSASVLKSPDASRNTSPIRPQPQPARASTQPLPQNNQNSQAPQLKPLLPTNADGKPHWPVSPRLKSPPPTSTTSLSRRSSQSSIKQLDLDAKPSSQDSSAAPTPTSIVSDQSLRNARTSLSSPTATNTSITNAKGPRNSSGVAPTLETVQEGDQSVSPTPKSSFMALDATSKAPSNQQLDKGSQQPRSPVTTTTNAIDKRKVPSALVPSKIRASAEGSTQTMIVETETVSSIPQNATTATASTPSNPRPDASGSLRAKPSSDTIRPKKSSRKKVVKKAPSIASGTTSTKADLFEAKVASEIEGDSDDSDETFVYESNPPEPRSRSVRHHSRTPSTNSMQSLATDRRAGMRSIGHVLDNTKVKPKRSMKFSTNTYGIGGSNGGTSSMDEADDLNMGTVRANRTRNKYQHMGLVGNRSDGEVENDSPFSQAAKLRIDSTGDPHLTPRIKSPRTPPRKGPMYPLDYKGSSGDESTPLLTGTGSLRQPRTRTRKPTAASHLRNEMYYTEPERNCFTSMSGCFILTAMLLLVVLGASGFLLTTTKPLYEVSVLSIENVLASEQEIMLDLNIQAVNPNIMTVTITDMDVNIFAKSRYVGSDSFVHDHEPAPPLDGSDPTMPHRRPSISSQQSDRDDHTDGGVDHGTDPPDDDLEGDPATMLLGRILHFDSALTFEGSPIRRSLQNSSGEVRLQKPGNKTEAGGTARWERVMQHPFELIVRGILKYQLPLSSRTLTKSIGASITVKPDKDISDPDDDDGHGHKGGKHKHDPPNDGDDDDDSGGGGGGGGNVGPPGVNSTALRSPSPGKVAIAFGDIRPRPSKRRRSI